MERLLDYFVPEKYLLDLAIDKHAGTIQGKVTITGAAKKDTIKLHAVNLEIDNVEVNGEPTNFKREKDTIVITPIIPQNDTKVKITYHGQLNTNMQGAYLSTYEYEGRTETIVATQFESHYAREAFPCIDEPAAKAIFELNIRTPDKDDLILTNVALGEPTPRMSTYLLAFVIGRFHGKTITNQNGVKITTYCALNQDIDSVNFANEVAAKSLEFFDANFGVPYPLTKLDQVALPDFDAGAMENWGLVTYRESMMLVGKTAPLSTKKIVALTVAHELSHQWFGNLVTMQWWDDLWLNESFASVMEYYATDHIYPDFKIFERFFTNDCYSALLRDAHRDVQSVHQEVHEPAEIDTLFDSAIVYSKGARLIFMLIRLMGWDNFTKGLKDYFKKHQYQNTIGDDFWAALTPYADFDPAKLMHSFIDQPGYPVITGTTQKRFLFDGKMPDSNWPLPAISEDMSGHYILNLTDAEFSDRLKNFANLGLEEKLRLLIDRDLITKTPLASAASLVPLAFEFKNEDSASVWLLVSDLVGNLKTYFDPDSEGENLLKKYTLSLIDHKLTETGIVPAPDDDENTLRLRANLLNLDYFAEDETRLAKLAALYSEDYTKMHPEIRSDILSAKIYLEPNLVDDYLKKYQQITDPDVKSDYLAAACLARDESELAKLLALLGENNIVKPQNQLYLFVYLYRNHRSRANAFDWLVDNWDVVKKLGGEKSLSDYPSIIGRFARTDWELEKFQSFFGPQKSDPGLARAIKIAENSIKSRLTLIKKDRPAILAALRSHTKNLKPELIEK